MTINESIGVAKLFALAGVVITGIAATVFTTAGNDKIDDNNYYPTYRRSSIYDDYYDRFVAHPSYTSTSIPMNQFGRMQRYYASAPVVSVPQQTIPVQQTSPMEGSRRFAGDYQMTPQTVYEYHQPQYQLPTQQFQAPMMNQSYQVPVGYQPIKNDYTEMRWHDVTNPYSEQHIQYANQNATVQPRQTAVVSTPYPYGYDAAHVQKNYYQQPTQVYKTQSYVMPNPYPSYGYDYGNGGGQYMPRFPESNNRISVSYYNANLPTSGDYYSYGSTRNTQTSNGYGDTDELRWKNTTFAQQNPEYFDSSWRSSGYSGVVPCFVTEDGRPLFNPHIQ